VGVEIKPILSRLDCLREEFRCGFILVDHFSKTGNLRSSRGGQRLAGSVRKHAWGESSLYVFPTHHENTVRVVTELKDTTSETFRLMLDGAEGQPVTLQWSPDAKNKVAARKKTLLAVVVDLGGQQRWVVAREVAKAASVSINTAVTYLNALVDEDRLLKRTRRLVGKCWTDHWRVRKKERKRKTSR